VRICRKPPNRWEKYTYINIHLTEISTGNYYYFQIGTMCIRALMLWCAYRIVKEHEATMMADVEPRSKHEDLLHGRGLAWIEN
jgi:hypothetical protein